MKRLLSVFLFFMCIPLITGPTQAAYVELRPDSISMTSDGEFYDPGDGDVSLEVWIMPDAGDTTLDNYAFDIWYDTSETIMYTGGTATPPSGWFPLSTEVLVDASPYVQNFEGFTFGPGVDITPGVLVATLDFTFAYQALALDTLADFSVYYRLGQGMTTNGAMLAINPGSIGPDLAAVPIPGAAILLGSGLLALVGIRKKSELNIAR